MRMRAVVIVIKLIMDCVYPIPRHAITLMMYMEQARQDRTEMLRIEARLSVIEAKLEKVEEWCKRLIDELNAKNAKK